MVSRLRLALAAGFLFAIASSCYAQQPASGAEVDVESVRRLGDHVQRVDGYQGPEDLFAQAMELPPDDASKWFISKLVLPNCPLCDDWKAKWASNPNLLSLAKPDRGKAAESWAHYGEFDMTDRSQVHRFGALRIDSYPVYVVQPPKNGEYGPATTVVYQATGSQLARMTGDDLHREILAAVNAYCEKLAQQRRVEQASPSTQPSGVRPPVEGTNRLPPWPFDPSEAPPEGFLPLLPKGQTPEIPPRSIIDRATGWTLQGILSGLFNGLEGFTGGWAAELLILAGSVLLARFLGYTPADAKALLQKVFDSVKKKPAEPPPAAVTAQATSPGGLFTAPPSVAAPEGTVCNPLTPEAEARIAAAVADRLQRPPST